MNGDLLEDRALLDRFRAGDRAALAAVYRAYAPEVARLAARGFSFRSGADTQRFFGFHEPHEQQDVVQEVFIRAFSERGRLAYSGLAPYGAYLRSIVKNVVIDELRKRQSAMNVFGPPGSGDIDEIEDAPAREDLPDVVLHRGRIQDAMKGFVDTLPEREKRFVALRYTEGLAQEDVAARLRVGRSTVRTLEERVRRKLHDRLREAGLLDDRPPGLVERVAGVFGRLAPSLLSLFIVVAGGSHA